MAMALFLIVILAVVSFGAVNYATLDSREAVQVVRGAQAYYTARAGLADAVAQLEFDYGLTSIGSRASPKEFIEDKAFYYVTITPGPNNTVVTDKIWKVTSTGIYEGVERTIEAWVQLESFAKYAYFTDYEFTPGGSPIWFVGRDAITGPAHTNSYFRIYTNPRFSDKTTSANRGDSLYDPVKYTYRQGGIQTDPARFYRYFDRRGYSAHYPVALNGSPRFSFAGGQSEVPLPVDTGAIKANATKSYSGGEYGFLFQGNGNLKVYRRGRRGWTFVENVDTTQSPGVTLHVDGKLQVYGTVQGRVTIGATDDIQIIGDLVYADKTRDVLGIVGEKDILVVSNPYRRQDRYIHASLMALKGSFTVKDYYRGRPRGTLHVLGGIIQKYRGPVGTFSYGGIRTGYTKDYQYDEKLLSKPPLNFPTTGNIVIRSLLDRGALGSS